MICGSVGPKIRLGKAAGAESPVQMKNTKLHAALARSTLQVKMLKKQHVRTTFGSWDVEKWHAAVARSTCSSQNVQNTPCSDHFWKLGCGKMAHRCGAEHIFKSKCTKHNMLVGPLLEVRMSKDGTRLWREAHIQVQMLKA